MISKNTTRILDSMKTVASRDSKINRLEKLKILVYFGKFL